MPFDFGADEVNLDDMVSATCTVNKGDLPIDINWIHADTKGVERKLMTNDGVVITRTNQRISMLSIEAVKARHRGNFSCTAKNRAGSSQHSAFLAINGLRGFLMNFLRFSSPLFLQFISINFFNFSTEF